MDAPAFRPEIDAGRLRLRPLALSDAEAFARGANLDAVARMTGTFVVPYLEPAAAFFILRQPSLERRGLAKNWALEQQGELCGCIGVFRRDGGPEWEIGYWLAAPYWGRGLASRAVAATLAEFRRALPDRALQARVFHDNPASQRVLEKGGFRKVGTGRGHSMQRQAWVDEIRFLADG